MVVTQSRDNLGRVVQYEYDGSGRLWKVTDPAGGLTAYTYNGVHLMTTITDARRRPAEPAQCQDLLR